MFVLAYESLSLLLLQILLVCVVCSLYLWSLSLPVCAYLTLALERCTSSLLGEFLLFLDTLLGAPPFSKPCEADLEFELHGVWQRVDKRCCGLGLVRDVTIDGTSSHAVGRRATAIAAVIAIIVATVVVVAREAIWLITINDSRRARAAALSAITIIAFATAVLLC
jgi:hypothetical protein